MKYTLLMTALAFLALAQTKLPAVPVPLLLEEKLAIQLSQAESKALSLEQQNISLRYPQIAEELKARQAAGQTAFAKACSRAGIPIEECQPDLQAWTLTRVPKPAAKPAEKEEVKK